MSQYKSILHTKELWAKEKRVPKKVEICFGLRDETNLHAHCVLISGCTGETHPYFLRPVEGVNSYISGCNTLVIAGKCYDY